MKTRTKIWLLGISFIFGTNLSADVMSVGPGDFPLGSTLITFDGLATGTEVNGLAVDGVLFNYTVGGNPLNGAVIIDGGPGITNNINPPNIVSIGDDTGVLTLTLPGLANIFGGGYAILATGSVANATTISLFNGTTFVGSLSYDGVLDPTFTGGFAGIESTNAFNKVEVTFNSVAAPAFALDNIMIGTVPAVPEPGSFILLATVVALGGLVFRRQTAHSSVKRSYLSPAAADRDR